MNVMDVAPMPPVQLMVKPVPLTFVGGFPIGSIIGAVGGAIIVVADHIFVDVGDPPAFTAVIVPVNQVDELTPLNVAVRVAIL